MKTSLKVICSFVFLFIAAVLFSSFRNEHSAKFDFPYEQAGLSERQAAAHLLSRFTYGARSGDVDEVVKMGLGKWFERQLNGGIKDEQLNEMLSKFEDINLSNSEVEDKYPRSAKVLRMAISDGSIHKDSVNKGDKKEYRKQIQDYMEVNGLKPQQELYRQFINQKILRASYTNNQLHELLTDFWFNHFNVSSDKGLDKIWIGAYEEKAIRPHVLGRFRDLLGATAHHAAMLFYLDNWQNSAPAAAEQSQLDGPANIQAINKKKNNKGINENYARELMELHTLGVDGGYTQKDVTELARVLTGLGTPNRGSMMGKLNRQMKNAAAQNPSMKNRFVRNYGQFVSADMLPGNKMLGSYFDAQRHDFGNKVIMGVTIKGEGEKEIEQVLDLLAKHPSTAKHISYKLAQYFVSDKPPQSLVDNLSQVYLKSDGNIATVLDALFHSNEFWDVKNQNAKFKSPYRFLISTLRATDTRIEDVQPAVNYLRQAGMPLYKCQTPDGYKNTQEAWLNPDNLVNRLNFATAFSAGRLRGMQPQIRKPELIAYSVPGTLSEKTSNAIKKAPPVMQMPLLLGSPEFMKY